MRVLLLNQCFHPDVVATAQYARDLAARLAREGHHVTVVASRHGYTDPSVVFPARETWNGCTVRRVWSPGLGKRARWRRILDAVAILGAFLYEMLRLPPFDVVVAMTNPPLLAVLAAIAVRIKGGRLVSWINDLNPDEAIAMGWVRADSWNARLLNRLFTYSLRASNLIIVLDRFMRDRVVIKGGDPGRVRILPPWCQERSVCHDAAGGHAFRVARGWDRRFVVMYSGNLSPIHPLDTLLEAARRLRGHADIVFAFVGGGNALPKVQAFAREHGLDNIRCLPYQPAAALSASLSAADLHVVVMGDAMVGIVHPCKIYNILGLRIPFLHIGPRNNHISDLLKEVREPGSAYTALHGETSAVVAAILDAAERKRGTSAELGRIAQGFSERVLLPELIEAVCQTASGDLMREPEPADTLTCRS